MTTRGGPATIQTLDHVTRTPRGTPVMTESFFTTRRRLIISIATFIAGSALAINCSSAQTVNTAKKQAGDAKDDEAGKGEKQQDPEKSDEENRTEEKNEWKKEGKEEGEKEIVRTDLPEDHRRTSTGKAKKQKKKKQKKQKQHKKAKRRKMKRKKLKQKKIR